MTQPLSEPPFRLAAHESITEDQINDLVDHFYDAIRRDERLGPLFNNRLAGRWDEHLAKMKDFWSSILLRTGRYKGKPVPAHTQIVETMPDDFSHWLAIFRPVANRIFHPEAAPIVIMTAERIAQNLWLAMFADIDNLTPPTWR